MAYFLYYIKAKYSTYVAMWLCGYIL